MPKTLITQTAAQDFAVALAGQPAAEIAKGIALILDAFDGNLSTHDYDRLLRLVLVDVAGRLNASDW